MKSSPALRVFCFSLLVMALVLTVQPFYAMDNTAQETFLPEAYSSLDSSEGAVTSTLSTGQPTLLFPLCGPWKVTGGYNGENGNHTSSLSKYALDFQVSVSPSPYYVPGTSADVNNLTRGQIVYAAHSGTVKHKDQMPPCGTPTCGGKMIELTYDGDTSYHTAYLHLDDRLVADGQYVNAGEPIAKVGSTGVSYNSPHLHFTLRRNGLSVLPEPMANWTGFSSKNQVHFRDCPSATPTRLPVHVVIPGRTFSDFIIRVRRADRDQDFKGSLVLTRRVTLTSSGSVSAVVDLGMLPSGQYIITAKADHTLAVGRTVSLVYGQTNTVVDFGTLPGGDYNIKDGTGAITSPQDDFTNIIDFGYFARNYYTTNAEMNLVGDTYLGIADFSYFAQNYNRQGAEYKYIVANGGPIPISAAAQPSAPTALDVSPQQVTGNAIPSLSPWYGQTYPVGSTFDMLVNLDPGGSSVSGLNVVLHYDSCALEVVSFPYEPTDLFPNQTQPTNLPEQGIVLISAENNVAGAGTTAIGTAARVQFRVVRGGVGTYFRLDFTDSATFDSNVVDSQSGRDVLMQGADAVHQLTGSPARPAVTGVPSPASNSYINSVLVPLSTTVNDGCGHPNAEQVKFEAYYEGAWHWLHMDNEQIDGWSYDWNAVDLADQIISVRTTIYGWDSSFPSITSSNVTLDRTPPVITAFSGPYEMSPSGTAILNWSATDNLAGIKSYTLQQQVGTSGDWTNLATNYTSTSYSLSGLATGSDYHFRLTVEDKAGNVSDYSETVTIRSVDNIPPTITWMEPVSANQVAEVYGQSVQLRVEATDDRAMQKVAFQRWDHPLQIWITLAEDTSAPYAHSLVTSTLNPGWNQVFATAYDATGNANDEYIWVSLEPPQAPSINTIANSDGDGSYNVNWSSSVGATGYELEENQNNGTWLQIYSGTGLSVSRTGRSAGTWCYRVQASNKAGDGAWSSTACTTVDPVNQPPNAPTSPTPANAATNVAITAALSWTGSDPNNDPLTYEVRFGTTNPPTQAVPSQSATSYDPPGNLANGTTYYWQIVANDGRGGVTSGPVWSFTTQNAANQPPNAPTNPNPANNATNVAVTATVSWTGSDPENDALTYEVRFGTANPPPQVVANQSGTSYDPSGNLANSTTYYWQVIAKDATHASGTAGPVWSFTTTGGTPTFPDVFYLSPAANVTIAGIAAQGADILRYTKSSNSWTMVYDGSVRGTLKNISAFALTDDGSLLLVFSANQVIAGLGTATPYDVVKFTPNTPGVFPLGVGTYSWFFQGRTKGLTTTAEKIDAFDLVGTRLLLSTTGAASVPLPGGGVLKAADEDAFTYNPTNNEWLTPLRLDGSIVPGLAAEDVNGIWDDPLNDDYYITILGVFNLGGVSGNDKSIVRLAPNGSGGWTPSLVTWLAPGATFAGKIDGLEIAR